MRCFWKKSASLLIAEINASFLSEPTDMLSFSSTRSKSFNAIVGSLLAAGPDNRPTHEPFKSYLMRNRGGTASYGLSMY